MQKLAIYADWILLREYLFHLFHRVHTLLPSLNHVNIALYKHYPLLTWTSHTRLYTLATKPTSSSWLPELVVVPNGVFIAVFFTCLITLYVLLILPYPRTSRTKQIVALPFLHVLVLGPVFFTCPYRLLHLALIVTAIATGTRFIDLYYIQPWTKVPSRYLLWSLDKVEKTDAHGGVKVMGAEQTKVQPLGLQHYHDEPLMWDWHRFKIELWSPVRIMSGKERTRKTANATRTVTSAKKTVRAGDKKQSQQHNNHEAKATLLPWHQLLGFNVFYYCMMDGLLFLLCHYSSAQANRLPLFQYGLFVASMGGVLALFILHVYYTIALLWALVRGRSADPTEFTMLTHYLPCFAFSPANFWNNWQTLFRYIWVDLGFLPVQRWTRRTLTPERVGSMFSRIAQSTLPVMAVFSLSGIFHAYSVLAAWREPIWSQMVYFWIQGFAVIACEAMKHTRPGRFLTRTYTHGHPVVGWLLHLVGMVLTWGFHILTLPLFVKPYMNNGVWLDMKECSTLWRRYHSDTLDA